MNFFLGQEPSPGRLGSGWLAGGVLAGWLARAGFWLAGGGRGPVGPAAAGAGRPGLAGLKSGLAAGSWSWGRQGARDVREWLDLRMTCSMSSALDIFFSNSGSVPYQNCDCRAFLIFRTIFLEVRRCKNANFRLLGYFHQWATRKYTSL